MRAMTLETTGSPLVPEERPGPPPRDGEIPVHEFLAVARHFHLGVETSTYRLEEANAALEELRKEDCRSTPVLVP